MSYRKLSKTSHIEGCTEPAKAVISYNTSWYSASVTIILFNFTPAFVDYLDFVEDARLACPGLATSISSYMDVSPTVDLTWARQFFRKRKRPT